MRGLVIRVRGQVQGVGFRPFVWQLARDFGLTGAVLNDAHGVLIRVAGADLDGFVAALAQQAPPLARVDAVEPAPWAPAHWPESFEIAASQGQGGETRVTPDAATCVSCLAEVLDPADRRHGYAFANCTHCGPRFSILDGLPYDRARTSMADFPLCAACAAEYQDPADRRFHAQPIACPACGPRVWIEPPTPGDPLGTAAARLLAGEVLAIKGLGGFHLACDATNGAAIACLRARKRRPSKPLAVMAPLAILRDFAQLSDAALARLTDPSAPIVLVPRAEGEALPDGLAPGQATLGWMLPYTPLHHLLLAAVGRPLVMTSGNVSGEPQVIGNDEARAKLAGFADGFLMHDRAIARRLDDSVERADPPMVLRRGRGQVPDTLPLPKGFEEAPQIIAYGGQMKSAICVIKNGQALLSHHLGELDDVLTWEAFQKAEADYRALFDLDPVAVACDLHPDFRASRHARGQGLPVVEVQHHHAHMAACLGENGWPLDGGKAVGVVLDGLGLGPDGSVWGGEVLVGDYTGFERCAWLKPAPLIGGDRAQMEPWRNALARLDQAGLADLADDSFPDAPLEMARKAAMTGVNAPLTSSVGRLFDAVAAILGICPMGQSFEGEAAMRLEALAMKARGLRRYNLGIGSPVASMAMGPLDPDAMIRAIATGCRAGEAPETLAFAFHQWLARAFDGMARTAFAAYGAETLVLTGGCFQNALLMALMRDQLKDLPVLCHRSTPSNDGSLALGQALIAAANLVNH